MNAPTQDDITNLVKAIGVMVLLVGILAFMIGAIFDHDHPRNPGKGQGGGGDHGIDTIDRTPPNTSVEMPVPLAAQIAATMAVSDPIDRAGIEAARLVNGQRFGPPPHSLPAPAQMPVEQPIEWGEYVKHNQEVRK